MWRLFQPLDYLKIKQREKTLFDWILPLLFALPLSLLWYVGDFRTVALANGGLVSQLQDLISILTGFFIAALAAVATFDGRSMDKPMPGRLPLLLKRSRATSDEQLTRRRFLCLLFGYLAFLALTMYLSSVLILSAGQPLATLYDVIRGYWTWLPVKVHLGFVFWVIYSVFLMQLIVNTLLGLYYLTDRIHRADGEHTVGAEKEDQPLK